MIAGVKVITEGRRGCGYRKTGGKYLITEGISMPCPALPLEVSRCPCCDAGIKPTRSWAWFSPKLFFKFPCPAECSIYQEHGRCEPFKQERAGIMWIGSTFYPTPESWAAEAKTMGVSKRIAQIPNDFVVGKTWVFVGHRKAIKKACPHCAGLNPVDVNLKDRTVKIVKDPECEECDDDGYIYTPGVFHAFCPTEIQQVVDKDVTEKQVEKMIKRGITPVYINRVDENGHPVDEDGELITEPLESEYVPVPTEEGYHEKVTDIINKNREAAADDHATLVNWKPGMHVRVTKGRDNEFEGMATIVSIIQGDKQGVHALVKFDNEWPAIAVERWVFAKDQDSSLDAYPNGL